MSRPAIRLVALLVVAVAACSDSPHPTAPPSASFDARADRDMMKHSAWIGTSITAGICSSGLVARCQDQSWAAQLARFSGRELRIPLVSGTGCKAPIKAPLISFQLESGEPVTVSAADAICEPNAPGVVLPTDVLAIPGANTAHALNMTPELQTDGLGSRQYLRILLPGETQVTLAEKSGAKFISVELGGNDMLTAQVGLLFPGVTYQPYSTWAPVYDQIINRIGTVAKDGILVGLVHDVATFPGLRYGSELWADRVNFQSAFNVAVDANCDNSPNMIFVPAKVVGAVAQGLGRRAAGAGPYTLSCADVPGTVDYVLSPTDVTTLNGQLSFMNLHIETRAAELGFAHFELDAVYSAPKPTFSVVSLMTGSEPYGPLFTLDGIHPSAAGHRILAEAAAQALNQKYALAIPIP